MIATVDRVQLLNRTFREHAPTLRGQLAGIAMIMVPALTNPIPFGRGWHTAIQILAVVVGFAGTLVVFGGLLDRVFLKADDGPGSNRADEPIRLDDVLLAMPHARRVWLGTAGLGLVLAVGALWCLVLVFTRSWEHLADVVMLGLPAAALGWALWRARVLVRPPAP
jgi:hypothetical protein